MKHARHRRRGHVLPNCFQRIKSVTKYQFNTNQMNSVSRDTLLHSYAEEKLTNQITNNISLTGLVSTMLSPAAGTSGLGRLRS